RLVIGFAAETQDLIENARAKLARKGCDWIVANDVSPETGIMGGEMNSVQLVTADGVESWPPQSKDEVARAIVTRIATALTGAAWGRRWRSASCGGRMRLICRFPPIRARSRPDSTSWPPFLPMHRSCSRPARAR